MKYLLPFLLLLAACGKGHLRDDSSISTIDAEYPSAEGVIQGRRFVGLAVVAATRGQELSELGFKIQTYFNGILRIDSNNCQVHYGKNYSDSELVDVPLTGQATQSCEITFTVSPTLPRQANTSIVVHGFRGHVLIKVLDPEDMWTGYTAKIPGAVAVVKDSIWNPGENLRLVAGGCGKVFDQRLIAGPDGKISIDLGKMVEDKKQTCALDGVLMGDTREFLFSALMSLYDPDFSPLPLPDLEDGDSLCATGAEAISLVALSQVDYLRYILGTGGCLNYDHNAPATFRALTVKGRSAVAEYTPGIGWRYL